MSAAKLEAESDELKRTISCFVDFGRPASLSREESYFTLLANSTCIPSFFSVMLLALLRSDLNFDEQT
jgi:hypothetical protein